MIRAFAAIPLPPEVTDALEVAQDLLRAGRHVLPEDMHLTLVFLGEMRRPDLEEVHAAFEAIRAPAFDLRFSGMGVFGHAAPRSVHATVEECPPLRRLQAKVAQAARLAGVEVEARRYVPHVTLARFRRAEGAAADALVPGGGTIPVPPMRVDAFCLYRSTLGRDGPIYDELARYPLGEG